MFSCVSSGLTGEVMSVWVSKERESGITSESLGDLSDSVFLRLIHHLEVERHTVLAEMFPRYLSRA